MKFKSLLSTTGNKLSRATGHVELKIKKNSPEILMGVGIVGIVATVVTACRATLKAEEVLDEHAQKMEMIADAIECQDEDNPYPEEMIKKDKLTTYVQTGVGFVKLYAPSAAIGGFSIACVLVANRILKKRYLAVLGAYNAISASYAQYRSRVRERYGDDVDYELRYGVRKEKLETKEVDENGKTVKKKEDVEVISCQPSEYARYWSKHIKDGVLNPNWDENPEFRLMFLRGAQAEANVTLKSRGYIFLNEVYDLLGFEHTQIGQLVGWYNDDEYGDGYVDFGLYDLNNRENRRFINGEEGVILLDFNCDGFIWDKI